MTRSLLCLCVLLCAVGVSVTVFVPDVVHAAGMEEEARRQLGYAEQELARGEFDKAVKSAESALRLHPTLYGAFVTKALAYEGLGNAELAEALLLAYQELTKNIEQDPRAQGALTRLRAPASNKRPRKIRAESAKSTKSTKPAAASNPDEMEQRINAALSAGQCASGRAAATELTLGLPEHADGWRLLGDAHRCSAATREAVLAYRRYAALGGADIGVLRLTEDLAGTLATLLVQVVHEDSAIVPLVWVTVEAEELSPEVVRQGYSFKDLPLGTPFEVGVAGRGLEAMRREVPALSHGEARTVVLRPGYVGLAEVTLHPHEPELCETLLATPDGETPIAPGETRTVTAGVVVALVANEHGLVEVPFELAPGGKLDFDPTPWVPQGLTLIGLPAGSSVRVFVEGRDGAMVEQEFELPRRLGDFDSATGVRLAPPHRIDSVLSGLGGVFVEHPRLGTGSAELALTATSVNAMTFPWRDLEGVAAVRAEHDIWARKDRAIRGRTTGGVVAGIGLAAGGALAGGLLWAGAVSKGREAAAAKAAAFDAQSAGEPEVVSEQVARSRQALDAERGLAIAGSVAGARCRWTRRHRGLRWHRPSRSGPHGSLGGAMTDRTPELARLAFLGGMTRTC